MLRKPQRHCPICGTEYDYNPNRLKSYGRGMTCSRRCSYIYRGQQKRRGIQLSCSFCGTQFTRTLSQIKSQHEGAYCSRRCHYRGRSIGLTKRLVRKPYVIVARYDRRAVVLKAWITRRRLGKDKQSDATRTRLREATARAIASGAITTVSRLEDIVADVLDTYGIRFSRQYPVRSADGRYIGVADFWLNEWRVFLEVNGTFWHTDPRTYPNGPIHAIQKRNAIAWRRKMVAFSRLAPVAVVWESDIRKDARQAVETALERIS